MARWLFAPLIAFACASQESSSAVKEVPADAMAVLVGAAFVTRPLTPAATITGAASYHASNGAHWLIATMSSDAIVVFDALTGDSLRTIGAPGTGMGELRGAAGVTVLGDSVALVVERENGRVQGFHLPDFASIGTFGDRLIGEPVAITAYPAGNAYAVYVAYNTGTSIARVAQFRVTLGKGELIAIHWRTFGDTTGNGAIHSPEAIAVDQVHNRLMIAESGSETSAIRVYDADGHFTGRVIADGGTKAGGIAMYACDPERGYWVTTGGRDSANTFTVFDRKSLVRVGSFAATNGQMDRILGLSSRPYGAFSAGVAIGTSTDGRLATISWRDIASGLRLQSDCDGR